MKVWADAVETLANFAGKYPQTAFAGLSRSLQQEWQHLQRTTPGVGHLFAPVEKSITKRFLPALLSLPVEAVKEMHPLLVLPVREGGLAFQALPPLQIARTWTLSRS